MCATTIAAGDAVLCTRNSAEVQLRLSRRICSYGDASATIHCEPVWCRLLLLSPFLPTTTRPTISYARPPLPLLGATASFLSSILTSRPHNEMSVSSMTGSSTSSPTSSSPSLLYALFVYAFRYLFHWLTFSLPPLSLFPFLHRPTCPPYPLHASHPLLCLSPTNRPPPRPSMPFTYILTHTAILGLLLSKSLVLLSVVFCHSMSRFFTSHLMYTLYTYIITTLDLDHRM